MDLCEVLMPRDQWSTILGHSPDVADARSRACCWLHEWRHLRIPRKGRFNAGASQVGVRGFCSALLCSALIARDIALFRDVP